MNFKRSLLVTFFIISIVMPAKAFDLRGGLGLFEPNDGLVNDVFDVGPAYVIRAGWQGSPTFYWITGLELYNLESQVFTSKTEASLLLLDLGFQQHFPRVAGSVSVAPFFGAGLSLVQVDTSTNSPATKSVTETEHTLGAYWEGGLDMPILSTASHIILKLKDQLIRKNVLGETNVGGKTIFLLYRYQF